MTAHKQAHNVNATHSADRVYFCDFTPKNNSWTSLHFYV